MRPVNKGEAPDVEFKRYQDAEPYLEERLGAYCSFCELPLKHVPEVEHREAKSQGGELLTWDNLLLACKYCNTRKGVKVKCGDKDNYLWPDQDDTFHAFSYVGVLPELNESYLELQEPAIRDKAKKLFKLVKLDNRPSIQEKDRRFFERNEARNNAVASKNGWMKLKDTEFREIYLDQIIRLAKSDGFFSTWMEVFKDEIEVQRELVHVFLGTREKYFGEIL